ncbi:NAD(P)H-binding protein [Dactylosporangium vinaceum]|uniref:NAD(P)H-binding protein n=1 Tax=Dactylosporangium vinaceum TaxID=53362 RepID=A0ABV5MRD9_9ACTN|nr:NAD(P)H-binding protein [Dactylosporangium vinaceum]UAC00491.1 NAD(P)H-binding protein [Dactylosporangium vinaceum]
MDMHLILAGTGKTGRRIAQRLRAGNVPTRTAARGGADAGFDLGDPGTWGPALAGVTAAYLVEPDLRAVRLPGFVTAAAAHGVRRLVLLSAPGAVHPQHPLFAVEAAVRASGAAWTVLRPGWFAQNFTETGWREQLLGGELALPAGDGRTPFVDAEDIADVAVAALSTDRLAGAELGLTGPRALSFGAAVSQIAAATGRSMRFVDVDAETYVAREVAAGTAPAVARIMAGVFTALREGRDAGPQDGVERALGRPPREFARYVAGIRW